MSVHIFNGDCRTILPQFPAQRVHCCVTSPPYFGLRDYGVSGQIGLEQTPQEYVDQLVGVFREVRRVLRDDGTLWLNLGDSYNSGPSGGLGGSTLGGGQTNQAKSNRAWRNGSGRADGVVDGRAQRNRNGVRALGLKPKDLIGIPWRVAFALQADGWYLRQDIIWHKPNPMPESVRDRCTKAHEYIFMFSKNPTYFFDSASMQEPATNRPPGNKKPTKGGREYQQVDGEHHRTAANLHKIGARETRNRRSVWTVIPKPFKEAHFATFPPDLIEPCILAGSPAGGLVLDPFGGAGTTALVAQKHGRMALSIELNASYVEMQRRRLNLARAP